MSRTTALMLGLVSLAFGCQPKDSAAPPAADAAASAAVPAASAPRASCEAFPYGFPTKPLFEGATCTRASDCVAVAVAGGCIATKRSALASLEGPYRDWVRLGCHRPSGGPEVLATVPPPEIATRCGPDVADVTCQAGTCELTASDCEFGGMRRSECEGKGGVWGGCTSGRGRLPGCNLPTTDEGKTCRDRRDCQGACVNGACSRHRSYKGCGYMIDGKTMCVE